jgi:acyl carrier protein
MLEFLFELEDHFSISIPQDEAVNAKTIRLLASLVDQLLATAPTPPLG